MTDAKPLALRPQMTPTTWQVIQQIAPAIAKGRVWPMPSAEAAMTVMLMGAELGLSFTASFQYIHFIEGKPSLSPQGALAIIRQSGLLESIKIEDIAKPVIGCTVTMVRKGGESYSVTWTMDDAKRAGLVKEKGAWEKYGPNLCRWRSVGFVSDVLFPDVLGGLKRADEFGAEINAAGEVIEAQWTPSSPPVEVQAPAPAVDVESLIERYGADAFAAAGGMEAQTDEQLRAVAIKLAEAPTSTGGVG